MNKIYNFNLLINDFIYAINEEMKSIIYDYNDLIVEVNYDKIEIRNNQMSVPLVQLIIFFRIFHYFIITNYKNYVQKIAKIFINITRTDIKELSIQDSIKLKNYIDRLCSSQELNKRDFTFGKANSGRNHRVLLGNNKIDGWISLKWNRLPSPYNIFSIMIKDKNRKIQIFKFGKKH